MKPIPFDPEKNLQPIPFNTEICLRAKEMKDLGLGWQPHVGCFVWDPGAVIEADSPFPERIYFILSLPRFIAIFGSVDNIADKLIWLPTWQQARELCRQLGISDESLATLWQQSPPPAAGDDLLAIYGLIIGTLKGGIRQG